MFEVRDRAGAVLSEAHDAHSARYAARVHIEEDGEKPPLTIYTPAGRWFETVERCPRTGNLVWHTVQGRL